MIHIDPNLILFVVGAAWWVWGVIVGLTLRRLAA